MSIYSVFLDKDQYFNKGIALGSFSINDLADIINRYLSITQDIDSIYIAGACYGRNKKM